MLTCSLGLVAWAEAMLMYGGAVIGSTARGLSIMITIIVVITVMISSSPLLLCVLANSPVTLAGSVYIFGGSSVAGDATILALGWPSASGSSSFCYDA